ncbi:hypothetical protein TRFO_27659 [Tritrichomonas foetus]|uniref:Anaphase-promoting complex subunit 4-like WD40 domain-containing protein n=1 Tax=Tritrichomonas foetus TaxID=1144522 RepID=A0A1J4K1G6_9EUKA|nr:hypothetical protein TRFO_27659 [Tritrichomonas foetus]|eukprot:OHT04802.1 hypothetical protein TRFO_27659 [Tritrichomonas foetus]
MERILQSFTDQNQKPVPNSWRLSVDITDLVIRQFSKNHRLSKKSEKLEKKIDKYGKRQIYWNTVNDIEKITTEIKIIDQLIIDMQKTVGSLVDENSNQAEQIKKLQEKNKKLMKKVEKKTSQNFHKCEIMKATQKKFKKQLNKLHIIDDEIKEATLERNRMLSQIGMLENTKEFNHRLVDLPSITRTERRTSLENVHTLEFRNNFCQSFSLSDLREDSEIKLHSHLVTALKYSNMGNYLATGGADSLISIISTGTQQCIHKINQKHGILSLDFNMTDSLLMSTSYDKTIRFYSTKDFSEVKKYNKSDNSPKIFHAEFITDKQFIACSNEQRIKHYDIDRLKPLLSLKCASTPLYVTTLNKSYLTASSHADGRVCLWDSREHTPIQTIKENSSRVIQVLGINDSLIVSLSMNQCLNFIDKRGAKIIEKIKLLKASVNSEMCKMTLKDEMVLIGGQNGSIFEFSSQTFKQKSELTSNHKIPLITLASSSGNSLASGDQNGYVKIWT